MRLGLEVAGDVLAVAVHRGGLAGRPDDAPALGDDGRRVRPAFLLLASLEILRHRDSFRRSPPFCGGRPRTAAPANAVSIGRDARCRPSQGGSASRTTAGGWGPRVRGEQDGDRRAGPGATTDI